MIKQHGFLAGVVVLVLILSGVAIAASPDLPASLVGHRVRVTAPAFSTRTAVGQVVLHSKDTLRLELSRPDSGFCAIPVSAITKLELHNGRRSYWLVGTLAGGAAGLTTFLILDAKEPKNKGGLLSGLDDNLRPAIAAVLIGGGTVIGGVIGVLTHSDRWREMPLDGLPVPTVSVAGGRIGLTFVLRF